MLLKLPRIEECAWGELSEGPLGPHPEILDVSGLGVTVYISNKLPVEADTAGPGTSVD